MKVSIITVSYNSAKTIRDTLESIQSQDYPDIEYIIIDGASQDQTIHIIREYNGLVSKLVSEPDKGIYDAMNKGLGFATGDIVGILNSDDFYTTNQIISSVVNVFKTEKVDAVFGDVKFVASDNLNKVTRYYSSAKWYPEKFAFGYMPAHPSFFVKNEWYKKLGRYKIDYKISADYELLIRFLYVNKLSYHYISKPIVTMRSGGVSNNSLKSIYILNKEIIRGCKENGISTNFLKLSLKFFSKISEFINPKQE